MVFGAVLAALCMICAWGLFCTGGTADYAWDIPCYETERFRVCLALDWKGDRMLFAQDRRSGRRIGLNPDGPGYGQILDCIYGCGEWVYYIELTEDNGFFNQQYVKMEINGVNLSDFSRQSVLTLRLDGCEMDGFSFPAGREELAAFRRVRAFFIDVQSVYFFFPDSLLRVNRWSGRREIVCPMQPEPLCFPYDNSYENVR